jgi:hypothetical protein
MPKLAKKTQSAVKKAEAAKPSSYELLPRGKYVGTLAAVTEEDTDFGPRWVAEFSELTHVVSGESYPGRQWYNMPLPQDPDKVPDDFEPRQRRGQKRSKKEAWAEMQDFRVSVLKSFFESMGYTEDTDTDEMVEEEAKAILTVVQEAAKSGARKGEKFNRVKGLEALPADFELPEPSEDDDDEDDEF